MDISLADVMIHIDETLPSARRGEVEERLRGFDGVVSVRNSDEKPHLVIVEYRPDKVKAQALLASVRSEGVHAELVGL
jgi:hypothetical protein